MNDDDPLAMILDEIGS